MVPIMARPMRKWETRCSTTLSALTSLRRIWSPPVVFMISSSSMYTVKEWVCTGAWGTRPLGRGMPIMPAMKLVQPSRKKSQWKPPGFFNGNCFACAATLLWFYPIFEFSIIHSKSNSNSHDHNRTRAWAETLLEGLQISIWLRGSRSQSTTLDRPLDKKL